MLGIATLEHEAVNNTNPITYVFLYYTESRQEDGIHSLVIGPPATYLELAIARNLVTSI